MRPLLSLLLGSSSLAAAQYVLQEDFMAGDFASHWTFFSDYDPTNGYVNYVNQADALSEDLYQVQGGGSVYLGVDHTNNATGRGRDSLRLESNTIFNHGLFIIDLAHMPGGVCGVWPAFWLIGPDWPNNGEYDIIEAVNTDTSNLMSLKTGSQCTISNQLMSGSITSADCNVNTAGPVGCSIDADSSTSYGQGFNAGGGGVYATQWTSDAITVWVFPRGSIPSDITAGTPDPSTWGEPVSKFVTSCNLDSVFVDQQLIINIDFCGDYAGGYFWDTNPTCTGFATRCSDYVQGNPSAFVDTYWLINALRVYQNSAITSSSTTTTSTTMSSTMSSTSAMTTTTDVTTTTTTSTSMTDMTTTTTTAMSFMSTTTTSVTSQMTTTTSSSSGNGASSQSGVQPVSTDLTTTWTTSAMSTSAMSTSAMSTSAMSTLTTTPGLSSDPIGGSATSTSSSSGFTSTSTSTSNIGAAASSLSTWADWPADGTSTTKPARSWPHRISSTELVYTATLRTTWVEPCATGLVTKTTVIIATHCSCTKTPKPTIIMTTETLKVPKGWPVPTPFVVTRPAPMDPYGGPIGGASGHGSGGNPEGNAAGNPGKAPGQAAPSQVAPGHAPLGQAASGQMATVTGNKTPIAPENPVAPTSASTVNYQGRPWVGSQGGDGTTSTSPSRVGPWISNYTGAANAMAVSATIFVTVATIAFIFLELSGM